VYKLGKQTISACPYKTPRCHSLPNGLSVPDRPALRRLLASRSCKLWQRIWLSGAGTEQLWRVRVAAERCTNRLRLHLPAADETKYSLAMQHQGLDKAELMCASELPSTIACGGVPSMILDCDDRNREMKRAKKRAQRDRTAIHTCHGNLWH
jgi:hypothetical protein